MKIEEDKVYGRVKKILSPKFTEVIKRLYNDKKIIAALLCGSYAREEYRKGSDIDILIIIDMDLSGAQVVHYKINRKRLDIMLFEYSKILNCTNFENRLLKVLLKEAKLIFSKDNRLSKKIKKYIDYKSIYKRISEPEKQSIWYNLIWNIEKAKSYYMLDPQMSDALLVETHYFIGLFYAKLYDREIYNLSGSLKFMKCNDKKFWKEYNQVFKKRVRQVVIYKLLKKLPGFNKYIKERSYLGMNNFISPLTVTFPSTKKLLNFKRHLDKIVLDR